MISLYKTYFSEVGKKNFNKATALIDRGRILDRNGEIIATNIKTKDLYIDTRKVLDNYDLKRKLREIFPEKNNFFFDKIFNKKHYIRIKQHLTPNEINQLRKIGDPAIQFHNSVKRIYIHHNLFSHLTGFKSSNIKSVELIRNNLLQESHKAGLMLRPTWKPLHKLKPYLKCPKGNLKNTEEQHLRLINLPSSPQIIDN